MELDTKKIDDTVLALLQGRGDSAGTRGQQGRGPGRGGSCLPPLPQIRTCAINASGSSHRGLASRHAIRPLSVYSVPRLRVLTL